MNTNSTKRHRADQVLSVNINYQTRRRHYQLSSLRFETYYFYETLFNLKQRLNYFRYPFVEILLMSCRAKVNAN